MKKQFEIAKFGISVKSKFVPDSTHKSKQRHVFFPSAFLAFKHKNGATQYTHIKVGRNKSYFTSDP